VFLSAPRAELSTGISNEIAAEKAPARPRADLISGSSTEMAVPTCSAALGRVVHSSVPTANQGGVTQNY